MENKDKRTTESDISTRIIVSCCIVILAVFISITIYRDNQKEEEQENRIEDKTTFLLSKLYQEYNIKEVKYEKTIARDSSAFSTEKNYEDFYSVLLEDDTIIDLVVYDTNINDIYKVRKEDGK